MTTRSVMALLLASGAALAAPPVAAANPLVRVTGTSPYAAQCGTSPYPDSEVEFSLAAHPGDARRLVATWIQDPPRAPVTAFSADGGRTWSSVVPPALAACTGSEYVRSTDPWVSVGPDGVAYLASLLVGPDGIAPAIQVSRSDDTGRTWSAPVFVERRGEKEEPDDKPTMAADPFEAGHVALSWSHEHIESTPSGTRFFASIEASVSGDGARTWSPPAVVDTPPAGWTDGDAEILVPRRGELLCVFSRRELAPSGVPLAGGGVRYLASRSTDGGATWSAPATIGSGRSFYLRDREQSTPIRSGTTHVFSADASATGRVVVAWDDVRSADTSRIVLVSSDDGGRTWTRRRSVSKGADRPLNPDVAIAGNGAVALRFYDLRPDRRGDRALSTRSWLRVARRGVGFRCERPLGGVFDLRTAPVASGTTPGRFLGEYQGLVGLPAGFGAVFAQARPRARDGATDGFFAAESLVGAPPSGRGRAALVCPR